MDSDLLEDRSEDELMRRDLWAACIALLLWGLLQAWFMHGVVSYRHNRVASRQKQDRDAAGRYVAGPGGDGTRTRIGDASTEGLKSMGGTALSAGTAFA